MTHTSPSPDTLRIRLVNDLIARRLLTTARWKTAFRTVARDIFVDRFSVPDEHGLVEYDLTAPEHHAAALAAVHSDTTLITQQDTGGTATSSSTTPSLMALMLEHLDAQPRHRVLEVGTGTGYNAALRAHR
ncbi:hypothetical protein [Haloactinomyces albus]|uniref:Protein-L-isoaspartate O-methyltransferase n=1 Tax=Haloactinomyces albus TaxID=1352928 RepID=A0AAE3ZE79_9ACTN|nr:hypothetical protein [Haloactinomyces albus]MDR7303318.1 protein-L-isoaspartate O-methyltransferase [Haloactinomyces albus]